MKDQNSRERKPEPPTKRVMERWVAALIVTAAWLLTACKTQDVEATRSAAETRARETVSQTYGELSLTGGHVVPLAKIAANPTLYEGRQVRTEGEIQRVCQKKGCWLELSDADGTRAFVPMTGHAFAVPIDSVGSEALVEGIVHRRERTSAERKHLEADGAGDSIPALSIEANAVVIR